ncbi:acyl-CoA dehydrogenase family protein [Actinoallomurus bryophytorum]|uniref:Alkylation response protein AidB-like acyl-CoA dehydrogenase n=1 Tax=Actinoallomurus bryophytorum TaxID=1490222 RepID=A0A543BZ73_9ACTN|nr:acyl-CoA dehydrogenase family protein [Actinoallomurus bryophytorum]TQL90118.1 alkylation response protein AidB-like acyl-CoA dehydrogenase [Actinoallomurus bryophytorum]
MDLDFGPAEEEFRTEVRAWLRAHVPAEPLPSLETADGFAAHREWERTLGADRMVAVSWPREYGGRGVSLLQWLVFEEEYYAAGAPGRVNQNGTDLLATTLFRHGTPEQLARILPPIAAGEVIWAQAWSEPGAGSDLAGLRSTATRTRGGWLLGGQKTWSSRAPFADRAFGLFRSHPEAGRHRGLTYVMFPLDADGLTVRPIGRLDGKPAFAELFLDEVFVPDEDVIGVAGEGWKAAMSTAGNERGLTLRPPGRFMASVDRLVELWRERADPSDTALRDRLADVWIRCQAYRLKGFETISREDDIGVEASLTKVFWSELDVALHETALDLLGTDGELTSPWLEGYVFSLAGTIYAGTNEIQRNLIAERLLGLPRGAR